MSAEPGKPARLPPRWVVLSAWAVHRAIYRITRGRRGLRPATDSTWGMMRLRTIGRRSGVERAAILGYYEDGPRLWAKWGEYDGEENLNSWASRRPRETAVVILEPG